MNNIAEANTTIMITSTENGRIPFINIIINNSFFLREIKYEIDNAFVCNYNDGLAA